MRHIEKTLLTSTGPGKDGNLLTRTSRSLQALALVGLCTADPRLTLNAERGRLAAGGPLAYPPLCADTWLESDQDLAMRIWVFCAPKGTTAGLMACFLGARRACAGGEDELAAWMTHPPGL